MGVVRDSGCASKSAGLWRLTLVTSSCEVSTHQENPVVLSSNKRARKNHTEWRSRVVFTLGDACLFSGLTSKILPLDSVINFDAARSKRRRHVINVKTASHNRTGFTGHQSNW